MTGPRGASLYELADHIPEFDSPVLVHWLGGFVDAGHAGEGLTEHLLETLEHQVIARFDADLLIDYRARRPQMLFSDGAFRDYVRPELTLYAVTDHGGSPFLLLTGPEPDVMWERFVADVIDLIEQFGVRLTVGIHGIPNPVPHTRPIGVIAHATRPGLVTTDNLFDADILVPSSASSLLELRLGESGHDAIGFVARVPHYLSDSTYPSASLALLRSITTATGLLLPSDGLVEAAREADAAVGEQIDRNDQVASVVHALENQYDAFTGGSARGNLISGPTDLPSAEEIGSELERFLAELDGPDGPESGS
ncbi:MAG TPA: PAC2 family protein [Jiangellaceae bacterium]|nr:PAC2 family protein [Jiangellaceae bacterium]